MVCNYNIDYDAEPGKVVIKYQYYHLLRQKKWLLVAASIAVGIAICGICYVSEPYYKMIAGIFFLLFYFFLFGIWSEYTDKKNHKIEEQILFPIVDSLLDNCEKKYPSRCGVKYRSLFESQGDHDNTYGSRSVVAVLSNEDVVEYKARLDYDPDNKDLRVITMNLTNFICKDRRKRNVAIRKSRPFLSSSIIFNALSALILLIGIAIIVPSFRYLTSKGPWFMPLSFFTLLLVIALVISIANHIKGKTKVSKLIKNIMYFVAGIIGLPIVVCVPMMALAIEILWISICTFLFPMIMVLMAKEYYGLPLEYGTILFVFFSIGAVLVVYRPSYIRRVIEWFPLVRERNENEFKARLAEFLKYCYEPNTINFVLNLGYIVFVAISTILQLQHKGFLISKDIDNAILSSFVIFLAMTGIKDSYQSIKLTSKTFFVKLYRVAFGE